MYLKIITLLSLFISSTAFSQSNLMSCIDTRMNTYLTVDEKAKITPSISASEKVTIYSYFHPDEYKKVRSDCQLAQTAAQQQTQIAAANADQAQHAANQGSSSNSNNSNSSSGSSLAGIAQAAAPLAGKFLGGGSGSSSAPATPATAPTANTNSGATAAPQADATIKNANTVATDSAVQPSQSAASPSVTEAPKSVSNMTDQEIEAKINPDRVIGGDKASTQVATPPSASETSKAVADTKTISPDLAAPADKVGDTVKQGSNASVPSSAITTSAESREADLKKAQTTADGLKTLDASYFTRTNPAATKLSASIQRFIETKKTCATNANRAGFFCGEGTSPGAQAVKAMLTIGAPILAVINSAQKSCSSLSKVTTLAGAGLAAAQAVCSGTKIMCDMSCGNAQTQLTEIQTQLGSLKTAINGDREALSARCNMEDMGACAKAPEVSKATTQATTLEQTFSTENQKSPGTTPTLVAGCEGHIKDIALMGASIAGLAKAKSGADKCDKQLQTASGANISTQQFCEIPANTATDLCKCHVNPTALGCPNALASSPTDAASTNNQAGLNIKSPAGVSGFASDGSKMTPDSALNGSKNDLSTAGVSTPGYAPGSTNSNSKLGAGDATAASGSALGKAADDAMKSLKDAAKKWDFGSFGSSSGGGGSSSGGKFSTGGAAGSKDLSAIDRKIASDKIAAEVSPASGKSNWEKVKRMYIIKETSLLSK